MRWPYACYSFSTVEIRGLHHYIQCMMIFDALQDLKNAALSGEPLNFAEVAADYGLNENLLKRKFQESYPHGVVALKSESEMLTEKINATVERICAKYGVSVNDCQVRVVKGVKYTIIGRLAGSKKYHYSAVSHKDGLAWRLASLA